MWSCALRAASSADTCTGARGRATVRGLKAGWVAHVMGITQTYAPCAWRLAPQLALISVGVSGCKAGPCSCTYERSEHERSDPFLLASSKALLCYSTTLPLSSHLATCCEGPRVEGEQVDLPVHLHGAQEGFVLFNMHHLEGRPAWCTHAHMHTGTATQPRTSITSSLQCSQSFFLPPQARTCASTQPHTHSHAPASRPACSARRACPSPPARSGTARTAPPAPQRRARAPGRPAQGPAEWVQ